VYGLPAQHQPSRGRPRLIHIAVTLRSPQREPSIEKALRSRRISGNWVTSAIPSSIASGDRPPRVIVSSASSGVTFRKATGIDVRDEPGRAVREPEGVDRVEPVEVVRRHLGEAFPGAQRDEPDRPVPRSETAGDDEEERDPAAIRARGQIRQPLLEWRDKPNEGLLVEPGESRVPPLDEVASLAVEFEPESDPGRSRASFVGPRSGACR
jgi:hypothetical protein